MVHKQIMKYFLNLLNARKTCIYQKEKKRKKYNEKRHMKSNWMTRGMLNSINTKNMSYKVFIQADS